MIHPIRVTFSADVQRYLADMRRAATPVGFLPTRPFGPGKIGWRIWAGPLIFGRQKGIDNGVWHEKGMGWTATLCGVFVGWAR